MSQRLTLTELMPIAWTRLTRYKLLIENILHSYKKNWDDLEGTYAHICNMHIQWNIPYLGGLVRGGARNLEIVRNLESYYY